MRIAVYTFMLCCLLFGSAQADISSTQLSNYHINQWDGKSNLGNSKVTAIYQDKIGYLWIGTPSGLLRFDGSRFKKFDKSNTPAIKSDYISTIYQDKDHAIWIGTRGGGLVAFQNGIWKSYTTANGLSDDFVHTIISDWQGRLWIGTDFGLNILDQTRTKITAKKNILFDRIITSLEIGIKGELFVGTFRSGLFRMYNDDITQIGYNEGLHNLSITKLKTDSKGRIWIGTLGGLYYRDIYDEAVRQISGTANVPVTDILETNSKEIWYSSMINGINCVTEPSRGIKEIPDEFIHTIVEDKNGTIWAGTDVAGLIQLRESIIHSIALPNDYVITSVLVDESGKIWAGTRNSGLFVLDDGQIEAHFDQKNGISSNRITAVSRDHESGIWIGTRDAGISFIKKNKISQLLPDHHITTIFQDDTGLIYIGTSTALYVKNSDSIKTILENISVNSIIRDRNGNLVVATSAGIYQSSNAGFQRSEYKISDRYPDVLAVYEDQDGTLWLGTNGSGILMIKDDQVSSISVNEGLPDNHIVNIIADKTGNLWCGSYNGTFMLARK